LFAKKQRRDTLALTRVLTNYEAAMNLSSPRGLLLHGEVGTGKSMLVDLLAESLPNRKKKRWHFNTFMLETIARLESLRQSLALAGEADSEHSLLWLAKDMVEKSPILFLDEFQLPDRAASKILSSLLTTFFQLGGVLIASSNRMPDELSKASGVEYAPPPKGFARNWLGLGPSLQGRSNIYAANTEFAGFLDVLKARCEVWDMGGGRDWRRREIEALDVDVDEELRREIFEGLSDLQPMSVTNPEINDRRVSTTTTVSDGVKEEVAVTKILSPKKYMIASIDSEEAWQGLIQSSFPPATLIDWQPANLIVYGRNFTVPKQQAGVALWDFEELCKDTLGPADYITLASTYHTIILDNVPILTASLKNEARRLITLLDALYEAKCKLLIRAAAGPDNLFFPESQKPSLHNPSDSSTASSDPNDGDDAVYPETLSEVYQDQISPFRPNTSSYNPDYDADVKDPAHESGAQVDFAQTGAFTGEDEKFAYKRARSRLWEMCGARWHARDEPGWWKPLPMEVRRWERSSHARTEVGGEGEAESDVRMGGAVELDRPGGLQGKQLEQMEEREERRYISPFRGMQDPPPKIAWTHAWGMMTWGRKAGAWGKGVDGLDERKKSHNSKR
jgi:predicted ATPase